MIVSQRTGTTVLAITPAAGFIAFAIFEGPESLIDWGMRRPKSVKSANAKKRVGDLIDQYWPDVVVIEDCTRSRRGPQIQQTIRSIQTLASEKKVETVRVSRKASRNVLGTGYAVTRYQAAAAVAERFPELAAHLPSPRKFWKSQDNRISMFDAVVMALTFYCKESAPKEKARNSCAPF